MGRVKESKKKVYLSSRRKSRRNVALRSKQKQTVLDDISEVPILENRHATEILPVPGCSTHQDSQEQMDIESVSSAAGSALSPVMSEIIPEGRRFVDIAYLFQQLKEISNHSPFDCTVADIYVVKETRKGLQSTFTLKCKMCCVEKILRLDQESKTTVDINSAATLATISTGVGYSATEEFMSVLNVPFMSNKTYQLYHEKISNIIHNTAWKSMEEAARDEASMAKELGEVGKDGIPFITVVADGAWCKRSYNINYDALSGVACIIGQRTGKLLFLGVRNKYCSICAGAESKKVAVTEHLCYKNWSSTSTSMESDIIVEGFKRSVEMHNLKYLKLVGDGDSSVYKKILESRPYGNILVQKVECRNHLLRNFSTKIRDVCGRKRSNSKNIPVAPALRKLVLDSSQRMRTAILMAIRHRIKEDSKNFAEKVAALCKDLKNVPSHVFGEHKSCSELAYFKCTKKENEQNKVPELSRCGLYDDIEACFNRLIYNASSLIHNMDNNIAEQYNSIVCKFVGGKRVNFALKGSYQLRCEAAAVSFNAKGEYHRTVQKAMTQRSPSGFTKKFAERMRKSRTYYQSRKHTARVLFKRSRRKIALPDKDYGPKATPDPDMDNDLYESKKQLFLQEIKKTEEEINEIEENTRGQGGNPIWQQERSLRLTASNFGDICKMRVGTSCKNKIKNLLYTKFLGNVHTRYGTEKEPLAIKLFSEKFNFIVQPCGLFIESEKGIFGASPDGLLGEDGIIEVKCPSNASKLSPEDAIKTKVIKFATLDKDDNMKLKQNHNYFFQIQGQLHITKRNFCYFIVWTPLGMLVEKIQRDDTFWETKMEDKLKTFYYMCLLPEIIDPRYTRGLEIRNPKRE